MKKTKVVVVGSCIVDVATFAPRFPSDGESVVGTKMVFGPGGKGSNQATAASRSGAEVVMVSKIGRDFLSTIMKMHYSKEGMTEKYIGVTDEADTGTAVIEVNDNTGENRIIVVKGANALVSAEDVYAAEREIAEAGAVLTQLESSFESVEALIKLAKKYNKPVVLNPAPFQSVPDGFFNGVDYFTPNETEAEFFSGVKVIDEKSAREASEKLLALGVKNVIITLGKKGAYYTDGKKEALVPTTDLKARDTTGAGDAFNGGLCVALAEDMDIIEAIKFANCVASISVTREGTSPAMPTREESDELYRKFYGGKR